MSSLTLSGVEVLFFDVFGTVFDWYSTISQEVHDMGRKYGIDCDSSGFAREWRKGYFDTIRLRNGGTAGTMNTDEMMREILENMLSTDKWRTVASVMTDQDKGELCQAWHRLKAWPDAISGLATLKNKFIVVALSNGNVRLLVDLAKHANLPWDAVLSTELFGVFKPQPQVYLGGISHFSLTSTPEKCAMVACHLWDLEAAASHGMKTIYVRRDAHEPRDEPEVKTKSEVGGQVDFVVDSFEEIGGGLLAD